MDDRSKRDLPEVVAEISIEQHAMREDIAAMRQDISALRQETVAGNAALCQEIAESNRASRQELREGHGEMVQLFNGMTNAILNAMNRGNDRYHSTADEADSLKARVTNLENPAANAA